MLISPTYVGSGFSLSLFTLLSQQHVYAFQIHILSHSPSSSSILIPSKKSWLDEPRIKVPAINLNKKRKEKGNIKFQMVFLWFISLLGMGVGAPNNLASANVNQNSLSRVARIRKRIQLLELPV